MSIGTNPYHAPPPRKSRIWGPAQRFLIIGIVVLPMFAPLGLSLLLMEILAPKGTGILAGTICISGFVLFITIGIVIIVHSSYLLAKWLRSRFEPYLSAMYGIDFRTTPMVGLSPGSEVRSYNGDSCWDYGFIVLEPQRMAYMGELTSFELRPDQVESIAPIGVLKKIGMKFPKFVITWRAYPEAPSESFILEWGDARSFQQSLQMNQDILRWLTAWRAAGADNTTPNQFAPPQFPAFIPSTPMVEASPSGCMARLVAAAIAIVGMVSIMILLRVVCGKRAVGSLHYTFIIFGVIFFNWLSIRLQRWMDKRKAERNQQ